MSDDTAQEAPEAAPGTRARQRQRAPKSPEARLRGMAARRVERQLEALKATKDAAKLEKAAAALAQLNGSEAQEAAPPNAEDRPAQQETPPAPPEEQRGAPPGVNPRGPAWPSEAAIAEVAPLVRQGVEQLALLLKGTRFAIDQAVSVDVGGTSVTVSKVDTLTQGLTPLAAKYLPASMNTPEATAAVAIAMVFGAPLLQMALERVTGPRTAAPPVGLG